MNFSQIKIINCQVAMFRIIIWLNDRGSSNMMSQIFLFLFIIPLSDPKHLL